MKGGCQNTLGEQLINHIVSEKHKKKYVKFYNQQYNFKIHKNNIMNCPYPNCDEVLKIDPTFEERFYKCEQSHRFCSVCKILEYHDKKKCKNV